MERINSNILIEKFLDDSLSETEKSEFNLKYKTDPDFAKKTNSYLNIISSVKATEKLTAKLDNNKYKIRKNISFGIKYWSIAATTLLVVSVSSLIFFAVQLNKTNEKLLTYENKLNQLSLHNKENKTSALNTTESKNDQNNPEILSENNTNNLKYVADIIDIADNIKNNRKENSQRGSASNYRVYPIHSKLAYKENASLYIKFDNLSGSCNFILIHKNSSDTLINKKITKLVNNISFAQLDLLRGNQYYWLIKTGTSVLDVGTFVFLTEKELKNYKNITESKTDYIELFIKYYKNECYYDAYTLLKSGLKKYPNETFFKYYLDLYQLDF